MVLTFKTYNVFIKLMKRQYFVIIRAVNKYVHQEYVAKKFITIKLVNNIIHYLNNNLLQTGIHTAS